MVKSIFSSFSISIFYIKANSIGGYINYGVQRDFDNNNYISNKTEEESIFETEEFKKERYSE